MSSSRHGSKFMKSFSKFQKISLQNKSAYEGSDTKSFSWLPFGWSRASYQENFDGLNDTFNSTGIVADSIFMYANPEAAPLQQEKILLSSKAACPAQRMLDQQTTHSHPKLKELYRRRCGLPIDAKKVKDPLTDEQKKFIEKLKRCPNSPPTLDKFQGEAQQGYSHLKTNVSLPGKAELVSELPYWVKTGTLAGAIDLRNPEAYLANKSSVETDKCAQVEGNSLNLSNQPKCWSNTEKSENITAAEIEGDFELGTAHTYATLGDTEIKPCQIDNISSLPTQNVFSQSSKVSKNKLLRYFSSTSKGEKKKCQKLPSSVPPPSSHDKCAKAAGCGSRARENCTPVLKQQEQYEKLEVPFVSYSERLKNSISSSKMSECSRKDNRVPEDCRPSNEGLSIFGCGPPGPKAPGACTKRNQAPPRFNVYNAYNGGCDPSIKHFKSGTFGEPSSISCSSPHMKFRVSEPGTLSSPFSTPKRCFSSEGSSSKPRKTKEKGNEPVDWLKSKSPNECKKRQGKCDPNIKPYKSTSPPLIRTQFYSTPIITRVSNSRDLVSPNNPPKRYFSVAMKATKVKKAKKSCFEPKKIKKVSTEDDMKSPVACNKPPPPNRCDTAKCAPASIDCKKPTPIHQYRCPAKPSSKRRKRVKVAGRKMLLGYKVCNKPRRPPPFQCKPKVQLVRPQAPTPKRCPCFSPIPFENKGQACKKVRNAVEPNCNKPRGPDAPPKGKCEKC